MIKTIHKAKSRGYANHGWLESHHTFSFANYYDSERIRFGNLRVLNDDIIQPSMGFGKHPHDNMEIISIPISGSLKHEDSMGHQQIIGENEVQVMSAGSGIFHSEFNASNEKDANFLQIWIMSHLKNIKPVYNQQFFDPLLANNNWQILVDNENGPLKVNQNTIISRVFLSAGKEISYRLRETSERIYLFVIEGSIEVGDETFTARDGIGLEQVTEFKLKALINSIVLNIEL
jgi:redox-sensitive bicupin YhaK (pirin superfamily)